ncbi:hypothetical protein EV702DRAFT_1245597 [Suillus placidus]|uniref:NACHT domain-containing protein n=1 Tax=Suillus placidus TaxID=48579 RepID=A0A9P6ZNU5_9AGAM|nr:hypothetical protein EV702DRAFT_1245597 [Suillus placidus]
MPDPISVMAGGLTVLQVIQTIAQTSALLYGYVASARDADSSCQSLLNELGLIGGVLTTVTKIEEDSSLPNNLRQALSNLKDGPLTKLQIELKNLLPTDRESGKMAIKDKLKRPFKDTKASAISIDTWITLKDVKVEVWEVKLGFQEVSQGVEDLKKHSAAQEMHEKAEGRRKLLEWMNPVSCTEKHATSRSQRNPGTGRWIFQNDQFVAWNNSDRAFLWLNGQTGHGKTILASAVVDEIQGSSKAEPQTLAYFYCNFRDDRTTNAAAVLRSLIVQLLQQSQDDDWATKIGEKQDSNTEGNLDSLRNLWQQQCDAKPYPTDLGYLRKLLVEASTLVRLPVLVIDALDECKDYLNLVGHLVNLAQDAQLRLFVTGRSEPEIEEAFHNLPTVSLKDSAEQMKADICAHITEQLKTQKKLSRLSDALKRTILEKLLEKAEGMFRWVQCQLDIIMKCKRPDSIRKALDDLPAGLYETYDRIIYSIEERGQDDGPIAQRCLLFLAGAFTPLTLNQLNEAMMIEVGRSSLNEDLGVTDTMDIVAACGSLVTYNEKTRVVALSHYSVKEYLICRPNEILKSTSDMHARICKLLITYVLCDFVDEICATGEHPAIRLRSRFSWRRRDNVADVSKDHPLLSYAILGCKHLGHVSDKDPDIMDALSRLNSEFLRNTKKHRVLATQKRRRRQPVTDRWLSYAVTLPSLLFIPLEHGKPWMVESLVKQHPDLLDVDFAPGWGSPLIFAIAESPDCLSIVLKPGVHLNKLSSINPSLYSQPIPDGSHAPISWAAAIGSEVTVDFLLSQTEVDIPSNILHMAVRASNPSHKFILEFCRRGADVNFTVNGSTPLHYFLSTHPNRLSYDKSQLLPIVKELVEPSFNLSLQDQTTRTVLHIALDGHPEDVVTYLLKKNAGLSATATLLPDMWSWATNETWFPKVQATALAADQPCIRIKGKVIEATEESKIVEFSVAIIADCDNPNPICAVVVSAILNGEVSSYNVGHADLSYCNQSLQKDIQDSPKDDSRRFNFYFEWNRGQRVSSRLFDYHQENQVTSMLQQLSEDKDSIGTSLFIQMPKDVWNTKAFELGFWCILDIYRSPLPQS